MNFALYSQSQTDRTISLRIQRNGAVLIFEKSLHGEVIRSDEIAIDPVRAAWMIDAIKIELPYLTQEWGNEKAAVAWDEREPIEFTTFDAALIDSHRFPGLVAVHELLERVQQTGRASRAMVLQSDIPSRANNADPAEVAIAAVGFFTAHFFVATMLLLLFGTFAQAGGVGIVAWALGILVAVGATYFAGGFVTAKLVSGNGYRTAMWAALIAVGINIAVAFMQGNGGGSFCVVWLLPFLARFGASSAGSHPPH
jgi:hypothetical protein